MRDENGLSIPSISNVTSASDSVTLEATRSSPVVPAIPLNGLQRAPHTIRVRLGPISFRIPDSAFLPIQIIGRNKALGLVD
jgi:hypothetical protein